MLKPHHDLNISDALKGVVHASVGHLNQHLLDGLVVLFGVHTIGGSKLLGFVKLSGVDVHTYDPGRSSSLTAHDNSQTNSPQTEHSARGARLNLQSTPAIHCDIIFEARLLLNIVIKLWVAHVWNIPALRILLLQFKKFFDKHAAHDKAKI